MLKHNKKYCFFFFCSIVTLYNRLTGGTKFLLESKWFQSGYEFKNVINDEAKKSTYVIIGHLKFAWS